VIARGEAGEVRTAVEIAVSADDARAEALRRVIEFGGHLVALLTRWPR